MKKVSGKLLMLVGLFYVFCLITTCAADVFLPIEYYYGRWTNGHQLMGDIIWQENSETMKHSSYVYTSGGTRIGLLDIQDRVFFSDESDRVERATGVIAVRPSNRLQLGLDRFHYVKSRSDDQRRAYNVPVTTSWTGELDVFLSARWSNQDTIRLSDKFATYMYLVDTVVGEQAVTINGSVSLSQRTWERERFELSKNRILTTTRSESERNSWSLVGNILWGVRENLNVGFGLALGIRDADFRWFSAYILSRESARHFSEDSRYYFPSYRGMIVGSPVDGVFLSFKVAIGFEWGKSRSTEYSWFVDSIPDTVGFVNDESHSDREFQEKEASFSIGVHYISNGDFNSSIVLDDYNGFYRNMLFRRQFRASFLLDLSKAGDSDEDDLSKGEMAQEFAFGLYDGLEISSSFAYLWNHLERLHHGGYRFSEDVVWSASLRWRSYTYKQVSGPGWERDRPFDIGFGTIPGRGQTFLSVTYRPPGLFSRTGREASFLAFDRLMSTNTHTIESDWAVGLGRKFTVHGNLKLRIHKKYSDTRFYTLSLAKRLMGKMELSVSYSQTIYGSRAQYPIVRGELRGLL